MELRHLRYFLALAEQLHFGHAAEQLGIAQPSLSRQIRELEDEVGVVLFERTSRQVRLSDAGRALVEEARRTLEQADRALLAARRGQRGEIGQLRIGFHPSAANGIMPEAIKRFAARYPEVELVLRELSTPEQVEALEDRRIDVAFLRLPFTHEWLTVEPVLTEPLVAVLPDEHPLARRDDVPLEALAQETFIFWPRSIGAAQLDEIIGICRAAGFSPRIRFHTTGMPALLGLVATGLAVSLQPQSICNLARRGVVTRPLQPPAPAVTFAVVSRPAPVLPTVSALCEQAQLAAREVDFGYPPGAALAAAHQPPT